MSMGPTKIFIKVESSAEQQENLRNTRKSLKVIQKTSTDKENLVGRTTHAFIKSKSETEINDGEIKRKKLVTNACQTDPERLALSKITEDDLTTEGEPSEGYWKTLAEKRRVALDLSLKENEELYEEVNGLRDQLEMSNQMLDESKNLVEILTEMLEENECPADLINASIAEEACEQGMITPVKTTTDSETSKEEGKQQPNESDKVETAEPADE